MSTYRLRTWLCAVASAAVLAGSAAIAAAASAQNTGRQISSDAAKTIHLSSAPKVAPVAPPAGLAINRPTIPMANYVAAKNAAAAQAPGRAKPGAAAPVNSKVTLYAQVPSTNETQTTGGNRLPPGGDIATSSEWMVQVNNDVIVMLNWFTNAFVQANLSTLFQNGTDFIFDPRVIYDPYWNRFVVVASRCTDCNTSFSLSLLEIAVSQTGDPSGGWWLYSAAPTAGGFNDFPQLGMDLHSIIFTYNVFFFSGGHQGAIFAASKAYLYNGLPWDARLFDGGDCTIAPPYVLDNNGVDYLLQFCPGGQFCPDRLAAGHRPQHGRNQSIGQPGRRQTEWGSAAGGAAGPERSLHSRYRRQPVREPLVAGRQPDHQHRDNSLGRLSGPGLLQLQYRRDPTQPGIGRRFLRLADLL
jgi:hypothetical protein